MNQNEFLLINAGVVTLVIIFLLIVRRKPDQPVTLRLHDKDSGRDSSRSGQPGVPAKPGAPPPNVPPRAPPNPFGGGRAEKTLNVFFNFEGQNFDAFEVLQIPAGSSVAAAAIAHATLKKIARPEQGPLFDTAYAAIVNLKER